MSKRNEPQVQQAEASDFQAEASDFRVSEIVASERTLFRELRLDAITDDSPIEPIAHHLVVKGCHPSFASVDVGDTVKLAIVGIRKPASQGASQAKPEEEGEGS